VEERDRRGRADRQRRILPVGRHHEDRLRPRDLRRPARELSGPDRIVDEDRRAVSEIDAGHPTGGRWLVHGAPSGNAATAPRIPRTRRVAMNEPAAMRAKPMPIPGVKGSFRSTTPSTIATAGL